MSGEHLDRQLKAFSARLIEAVRLQASETGKVATLIAEEVRFLEPVRGLRFTQPASAPQGSAR
jgi:hypothetical protein